MLEPQSVRHERIAPQSGYVECELLPRESYYTVRCRHANELWPNAGSGWTPSTAGGHVMSAIADDNADENELLLDCHGY